ncbi:MAG TPA: hypothetical protein VGO15_10260 [Candidatus Limnocylindrales bacterium]|nr:hypothetical protein [Candidatus Limnocylindrales bacterium]
MSTSPPPTRGQRQLRGGDGRLRGLRPFLGGLAWLAIVVVIALGAAGIAGAMDHPPGSAGRAELTAVGDAEVGSLLDAAESKLSALADQVDALGAQARGALAALNGSDPTAGEAAIQRGDLLAADVVARTEVLRRELAAVPFVGRPDAGLDVSASVIARHAALVAALDATDGLDLAWAKLTAGSVAATKLSALLAEHDRLAGVAADLGVHARYADAIGMLDQAKAQIVAARILRDQLVATVDVSVIDDWLGRNEAYDAALRTLYREVSRIGRTVSPAARAAVKAEAAARARLPADRRGLVVIMADIGRGGMNRAVITIEEARGKLVDALDAGSAPRSGAPAASDGP